MMSHEELLDSIAAYALGLLPADEAAQVAAHLKTCKECREEYGFVRPAVTAVAFSAEACADATTGGAVAPPSLKARVMKHVRAEAVRRPQARVWPAYLAAAACLAIALLTGLAYVSLSARNATQQQTIADLVSPDSQHHPFAGGEVLTHGERLYLTMHGLPALPSGRVYQAWTIAKRATAVAPSSTFEPSAGGAAVVRLPEAAPTVGAVAVSVEPEGGSKQPTTKPIALVRL